MNPRYSMSRPTDELLVERRLDVNIVQRCRIELESRVGFENDVVLVELGVKRIDLPLAESIVKRVVDGLRRDAEARSRGAIDGQCRGHAAQLLIRRHIGEFGQLA